ncbi:MAG: LysR family transcriptional regulator [Nannocystales bacterium]
MSTFDVRSFNLNLVSALDALLRHRAVGAAAREVGVSQSAMSHSLAKLREQLGDPLLVPQGRRFELSARARAIAADLPELLDRLGATLGGGASFDPRTAELTIRIATVDYFELTVLPSLMLYLREHAPRIRLSIERLTPDSAALLQSGHLDFIFGGTMLVHGAGLECAELFQEPFTVIAREGHPTIRRRLTLKAYLGAVHVVVRFEGRGVPVVDRVLERAGHQRTVGLYVPHFVTAPLAVSESDMICTIARTVAERARALVGLRLFTPPIELPLALVRMWWPRVQEHDPGRTWFRRLLLSGKGMPPELGRRVRAAQAGSESGSGP